MKVGVVGCGFVGSTAAYALVMEGVGREIVLIDLDEQRARAEAADIMHAVPFAPPMQIRAGCYEAEIEPLRKAVFNNDVKQSIDHQVRRAAYEIIEGKGATYYGIGAALSQIVDALIHDQRAIMTITTRVDGVLGVSGVTLALPTLIGGDGVLGTLPISLDDEEASAFENSASVISEATDSLRGSL